MEKRYRNKIIIIIIIKTAATHGRVTATAQAIQQCVLSPDCVQPGKYRHCFEGNLGETAEGLGGARMGLSERYDAILS